MIANPIVAQRELTDDDEFLVLACDGKKVELENRSQSTLLPQYRFLYSLFNFQHHHRYLGLHVLAGSRDLCSQGYC